MLSRNFGNIMHDIAQNYININVSDLRKLQKLHIKQNKAQLDINFLINCKNFGVFPKFINVYLPNVDEKDMYGIKKKLRNNAIHKRIRERNDFDKKIKNVELQIKHILSNFDWYILAKLLRRNVKNKESTVLKTDQKEMRNLTKNSTNPFTHREVVKNLSSKQLTNEELDLLKFGLHHSLPPSRISKTNVFVSFEMMHRFLLENLKNEIDKPALKSELSHLANSTVHNYKPSRSTLRKHGILIKLKNDKSIVILRPDKRNGVVVLDRNQYDNAIKEIISDKTKFKELPEDVTIKREGKLQRFLRTLKNEKKCLNDVDYKFIYPSGSAPAKFYGTPKMHNLTDSDSFPELRPIVSSVGNYNYNLAKYLCNLLSPHLPEQYCTKDTLTFVEELKRVSLVDKFLVSFDVTSLFRNIPLSTTMKLAVDLIKTSQPYLKISEKDLTSLFNFATCETHFLIKGKFYDKIDEVSIL